VSKRTENLPSTQDKARVTAVALRDELLKNYQGVIVSMVGRDNMTRFTQNFYLALARNPDLITCNKKSLFLSCLYAAQRGLEVGVPDGVALVPYKGQVTPITQYQALIKKAVESGVIDSGRPVLVYKNDVFHYEEGSERRIMHVPTGLDENPGDVVGGYFSYEICGKTYFCPPLRLSDFEKARASSANWKFNKSGPWADWFESMCAKTVVHRAFKLLPLPSSLKQLVEDEGKVLADGDLAGVLDPDIIDLEVSEESATDAARTEPAKAGRGAALAGKLKDHPNNTPPPPPSPVAPEPQPETEPVMPFEAEAFFAPPQDAPPATSANLPPDGPEDNYTAPMFPEAEVVDPPQEGERDAGIAKTVAEIKAAAEARNVPFNLLAKKYGVKDWNEVAQLPSDKLSLILEFITRIRPATK